MQTHSENMSGVTRFLKEEEKSDFFQKAMYFLEEGEYEEACDFFAQLAASFPDDRGIWWQYLMALRRARLTDRADHCADECLSRFPTDVGFILEWTRCKDSRAEWAECLRRRQMMLQLHSPDNDIRFLPLVTECFLPLVELKDFSNIKKLVDGYWDLFISDGNCGAAVYYALETIGDYSRQIELCNRLLEKTGMENPIIGGVNYANLRSMAESAIWSQHAIAARGNKVNILSLGQSCLPYTVGNRWGLINYVGDPEITIFDLGAFGRNSVADALLTEFSEYLDPSNYYLGRDSAGAPQMFHKPSGVHFGHERGLTIIGNDQNNFHQLIKKKISSFQRRLEQGNTLLVYGVVGTCDLPLFVRSLEAILKESKSRLLVVNFTRNVMECPKSPYVTYEHIPFPVDYSWNSIGDYTSDRGLAFDIRYTSVVCRELDRMLQELND